MSTYGTVRSPDRQGQSLLSNAMVVVWAFALAKLAFHIYFNNRYGYFRDEFDYMSCGDHLTWGYVDQPPLNPFLIHICRAVLGDSLRSIRFIPAVASSLLVVQTALLAREFGGRRYALLLSALCYVVCYVAFYVLHGKNYYLAPIYPMLLAAGAVVIETAISRPRLTWLKPAIATVLLASGAHLAPVVVPVLSPDKFLAYTKYLPFKLPVSEHSHAHAPLPQWYSDQFGWKEIADEAAVAWNRVPADERGDCGIFAQDYGQAGAIDFFGRAHGLPGAMSGDRSYFLWGPRGYSGNCMIVLDDRQSILERYWDHVEFVGTSAANPYALEQQIDVFSARERSSIPGPMFGQV